MQSSSSDKLRVIAEEEKRKIQLPTTIESLNLNIEDLAIKVCLLECSR